MASLRKLRRRMRTWRRYTARYRHLSASARDPWPHLPPGYWRAQHAVLREEERRFWAETPEIWMGGPEGEQVLIADVLDWPPPTDEEQRRRDHLDACCDDLHNDPCEYCEQTDCLGDCWGEEYEDDEPAMRVITETAFAERGLL